MLDLPYQFAGNRVPFALQVSFAFHEMTANGAFGDASQATAEAGEAIIETAVQRAAVFLRDFAAGSGSEETP
jgi:creatinine amidohydrolase/Fe(II)-dependent formamide hydrolase-like protein